MTLKDENTKFRLAKHNTLDRPKKDAVQYKGKQLIKVT